MALFNVTDQAVGHAIKKLLVAGNRGHKDKLKDYREAVGSIERAIEIAEEEQPLFVQMVGRTTQEPVPIQPIEVPSIPYHPDDHGVDKFSKAMREKLKLKREQGEEGWNIPSKCSIDRLTSLFRLSLVKGDLVDIANFAMMLHQRGQRVIQSSLVQYPNDQN